MKIIVINRRDRLERLRESQKQFDLYGIEIEIFPAIIDSLGWKGCRDSHLAVLEKYKDEKCIMILEDDVLFLDDPRIPIAHATMELPENWDCLYLGASPKEPQKHYSAHLYKLHNAHVTHAIIWHNRKGGAIEFILSHKQDINKYDDYLASVIQPKFGCYIIFPILCTQRQEKSDTCHRSDASSIIRNYNKYCK
jgi:GR25 family glycosyltransferase involved in LPS biosynthesis